VITTLGFMPLDWKDVPFNDVLPAIFEYRKKAFLSRIVHGEACGTHVYLFNRASDVAWWSKKKMTIVFEQSQMRNSDDDVTRRLSEKGDAELAFHDPWCMIQARHEIEPTALRPQVYLNPIRAESCWPASTFRSRALSLAPRIRGSCAAKSSQ